jgi:hypothetical protein
VVQVRCGRKVVWGALAMHALAGLGALVLPPVAGLLTLAGIVLSAAAFLREAARPVFLNCHSGVATGWPDEGAAGGESWPVRVVPFLGRQLLVLEFAGPAGRRYRTLGRGDLPQEQFRTLLASARWPARRTGRAP